MFDSRQPFPSPRRRRAGHTPSRWLAGASSWAPRSILDVPVSWAPHPALSWPGVTYLGVPWALSPWGLSDEPVSSTTASTRLSRKRCWMSRRKGIDLGSHPLTGDGAVPSDWSLKTQGLDLNPAGTGAPNPPPVPALWEDEDFQRGLETCLARTEPHVPGHRGWSSVEQVGPSSGSHCVSGLHCGYCVLADGFGIPPSLGQLQEPSVCISQARHLLWVSFWGPVLANMPRSP